MGNPEENERASDIKVGNEFHFLLATPDLDLFPHASHSGVVVFVFG
jgi:hypothetical protein